MKIILASNSPRRRELLGSAGFAFEVQPSDVPEVRGEGEDPRSYVARLSREKASWIAFNRPDALVIGADTTVVLDEEVLEKPADADDAVRMLRTLSGRTHTVYTGLTVIRKDRNHVATVVTETLVTMKMLDDEEIRWYVSTGETMDKAGAYAVQGVGSWFIERIDGNYTNVVGLPLSSLFTMLRDAGFDPLQLNHRSIAR